MGISFAFFNAVDHGDVAEAAKLLAASPTAIGERIHGATAMHHAAARGDLAMLEFLLEHGALLDEVDESGASALSWATDEQRDEAVDLLLDRGAKATAVDLAARGLHAELAKLLDDAPWLLDQQTIQGTALHAAVRRGRTMAVELLLARGADLRQRDEDGRTASELALELGERAIAAAIERSRASRERSEQDAGELDALATESVSYRCGACAEQIVIEVDRTEGDLQRFVEDCPVCCRANVIEVRLSPGGGVASAELE